MNIYIYVYMQIYINIYMCICVYHFFVKYEFSDNTNGIQVVELEESFRMQKSKVIFVLQVSSYGRFCFGVPHLQLHH